MLSRVHATVERPSGLRRAAVLWRLWRREREDPVPFYRLLAAETADDLDRRYGPLAGQRIVDLGCGPGFYSEALRERGAEVVPVDNDLAEMSYAGEPPEGALIADAAALPLDDASLDGVLCSNLLEHTPDAGPSSARSSACCGPAAGATSRGPTGIRRGAVTT